MIEIDTPGHTSVVGDAYPDLVACQNFKPWWDYAAEPPSGQLRILDERAVQLAKEIYTRIAREVPGTLFSTGGDEVVRTSLAFILPTVCLSVESDHWYANFKCSTDSHHRSTKLEHFQKNQNCYKTDQPTQDALKDQNITLTEALFNFVNQTHDALRELGKTPVIWEELVLDEDLKLGLDTIVAVWRSSANARSVLDKGYRIIHAASDFAYLDW